MYELSIEIAFPKAEAAAIAYKAVMPELGSRDSKRSSTGVSIKKSTMSINIKANDKTALRAACNACLNSVILAKNISEV